MDKTYSFQQAEKLTQELWDKAQVGNPDAPGKPPSTGKTFSIIMPPPNANDPLHVGHAMFVTIEDILIRYHRMLGDATVWIPGTDHAGIETQFVFEKKLQKQGQSRFQFDRKTLYNMIWNYVQENSGVAVEQMKLLGASADWSRFHFTLDKKIVDQVIQTFVSLNEDGLIYRDKKLVNYCTKCGTSYSELEVKYVEKIDPLYYIKYGPFEVATVRPETKFADVALAVHPDDKRYTQFVGQKITIQDLGGEKTLPVIADDMVDPEFGTGVVKITPAHDPNDFAVAKRHNLSMPEVISRQGKMTALAEEFAGLSVLEARKQVVAKLKKLDLLSREPDNSYVHNVSTCYRCGRNLEPLPLSQFFLKVKDENNNLVKKALLALDKGETTIHGVGREKILRHWLENLEDWNISRQIVWGIPIPVWYNVLNQEENVTVGFIDLEGKYVTGTLKDTLAHYSVEEVESGLQNLSANQEIPYVVGVEKPTQEGLWLPETDTFDTWFSSGQWPVVTLKSNSADFEKYYPTSVMETAYDILLFWVMRMMLMGIYTTGKSPFQHVYLHGLVRDSKGQKMSKSKGNVVNPLEIVKEFGADALRWALVVRSTPGQDKSVGRGDFIAGRNLLNKLWNASRLIILFAQTNNINKANIGATDNPDPNYVKKLDNLVEEVTELLNKLKPGLAADKLYDVFWHWFCDEELEKFKKSERSFAEVLLGLTTFIKLFHPYIPHLTETIAQELKNTNLVDISILSHSKWPNGFFKKS